MKPKLNITVKLIGYLVIVSILPLLVFAFSSYDLVRQTILTLASQYSEQLVENQREYLQLQIEQVEDLASRIASIEEISAVAARTDAATDGARNDYDELSTQAEIRQSLNLYSNLKGVISIDFFTARGHRFYVGDTLTVPPINEQTRMKIFNQGIASPQPVQWLGVEDNLNIASANHKVLTAIKIIRRYSQEKQGSEPVGMLLINYSTDYLAEHFNRVDLGRDSSMEVVDAKGRLIYAPQKELIGTAMPPELEQLTKTSHSTTAIRLYHRDAIVTATCLQTPAWCVFGIIPEATLLAPMQRITEIAAALILLSFMVILLATRLFRRNIVAPIKAISDGFRRIQATQFENVAPLRVPDSQDEIRELVTWFNTFLETLRIRQQYEKELLESEHKFASIFQLSPMPLALVRMDTGEFVDANDFWLSQFDFSRDEVVGRTALQINLWVDPNDRLKMLDEIDRTQAIQRMEARFHTKGGRILVCLLSGRPFTFREQPLFIFSPVDISRQREIEQEIRDMNLQLETRVRSRTQKLELANQELGEAMESLKRTKSELVRSEKLAALGSLVAGVAHELNTPIGNSVTVASTMQDETNELKRLLQEGRIRRTTMEDYFEKVTTGAELLMRNLGNARELITGFKQVAADQASNQQRSFELRKTLEGILTTLAPMYKKAACVMLCDLQDNIVMNSYPGPLGQIITNFVTNALAHAFEGRSGGQMILRSRQLDDTHVEITFSDNGHGIPEENLTRVFDPFFTTKLGQGGSGLGLNIVYNIVTNLLGGSIELKSSIGLGTTFIIVLPMSVDSPTVKIEQ